ncbi:TolC family protein [Roseobacter weihaiensis]|uniref:TolC family protein n=1 Tax=Roseobacter weihaiensis TaxID=2763262 RepID=UPI001D0B551A|nr:TolC family protein [Roseobacter sp. H9]
MSNILKHLETRDRPGTIVVLFFFLTGCTVIPPEVFTTETATTLGEVSARKDQAPPSIVRDSTFKDSFFGKTVRQAVLDFPALSGQNARVSGAAARLDALQGSLLPQLSAGVSAGQAVAGDNSGATADAYVTVRQLIFDGAATKNRIALTQISQKQLTLELDVLLSSLSRRIATAALDLWEQTQLLELAGDDVAAHEVFVQQTRERVTGGTTTESDLLSALSRLADAQSQRAQAVAAQAQAQASYIALIGPLPVVSGLPPPLPRLSDELARNRIDTSSQLAVLRMRLAGAGAEVDVARSGRFPGIFLELTGRQTDLASEDSEFEVFAGFSVDQSIFSGGQQRAREEQAASNLRLAESVFDETRREIRRQLDVALANRSAAEQQAAAAAEAARANAAVLDAARIQFSIGRRGIVEILDAQRDLTSALAREIALQGVRIRTELEILEMTGDLATVFGIDHAGTKSARRAPHRMSAERVSEDG